MRRTNYMPPRPAPKDDLIEFKRAEELEEPIREYMRKLEEERQQKVEE